MAAGAAGLVYVRVDEGGVIDAAKPVKEGLTEAQAQALLVSTAAQPVRPLRCRLFCPALSTLPALLGRKQATCRQPGACGAVAPVGM